MAMRIEFPSPLPNVLREKRRVFRPVQKKNPMKLRPNLKLRRNPEVRRARRLLSGFEEPPLGRPVQPSPRELLGKIKAAPERSLRVASRAGNLERMMSMAKSVSRDLDLARRKQLLTGKNLRSSETRR